MHVWRFHLASLFTELDDVKSVFYVDYRNSYVNNARRHYPLITPTPTEDTNAQADYRDAARR